MAVPWGLDSCPLDEVRTRVADFGFRVTSIEDMSEVDLEYGWLPAREKLEGNEIRYRELIDEKWLRRAYAELDFDIQSRRSAREGNGRILAVRDCARLQS